MQISSIALRATQTTSHLFMVRPVRFGFNEQTSESNSFQNKDTSLKPDEIQAKALKEFDTFVDILRKNGMTVTVFEDQYTPHTPDSIFPNNWISLHKNGKIIIYPILAPNRRLEKRKEIIEHFTQLYDHPEIIDMGYHEADNKFLEGTGSMILDRINQIVYGCISPRTTPELFDEFCKIVECEQVAFTAVNEEGQAIYHTNVMMALGDQVAVICLESIPNQKEREMVRIRLEKTGHEIVEITFEQMNQFAGNMLQVYNKDGVPFMVMSKRAFESLNIEQLTLIRKYTKILVIPIDVIETYGGGSVRCMMAEVFN